MQVSLARTYPGQSVSKFVSHTFGFPLCQRLWALTKRRDDIVVADMVAKCTQLACLLLKLCEFIFTIVADDASVAVTPAGIPQKKPNGWSSNLPGTLGMARWIREESIHGQSAPHEPAGPFHKWPVDDQPRVFHLWPKGEEGNSSPEVSEVF